MSAAAKKILLTGGTGFIGQHLCNRLLNEGYILYILTRNKKLQGATEQHGKFYLNSLSDMHDVNIDIVINLAGENIAQRWTNTAKEKIYTSRIATTTNLINFLRSTPTKPELLISGSAVGYYGTSNDQTFTEANNASAGDTSFASSLCQAWEAEALQAASLGIRTVLLRIGPVLAQDGGILAKLLPSFRLGLGSQIGDGRQWLSWIDRDDLINLMIFIINQPKLAGPLNATAPNPSTNKDFSESLAAALHRPCYFKSPACVVQLLFGQMAEEIMLHGQKVLPEQALHHGFEFSYPMLHQSLAKILRV